MKLAKKIISKFFYARDKVLWYTSNVRRKLAALWRYLVIRALFIPEYLKFRYLLGKEKRGFLMSWRDKKACLDEKTGNTLFDSHYIYHPAWAARILARTKPEYHIDIASSLSFCTLLSAFIPVRFYDMRPAQIELSGLSSGHADLLHLPFPDNSIISLSCMHVVEHIGLGRYGDALNPGADLQAIKELKRVLAPKGSLLFVVPIGRPRVVFNAHRVYSYKQIVSYFSGLSLKEFALLPDDPSKGLVVRADWRLANKQNYGCGCFWFVKK